jgi:hemolysin III
LIFVIIAFNGISRILLIPKGYDIPVGYLGRAMAVVLPTILYRYLTVWNRLHYLFLIIFACGLAVTCYSLDRKFEIDFLWMGTLWLLLTLGGIAVFWLMQYIYEDIEQQQRLQK